MAKSMPIIIGLALAGVFGAVVGSLMDGAEPPPTTTVARAETDPTVMRELEQLRKRMDALEKVAPMRALPEGVAVAELTSTIEEAVADAPAVPEVTQDAVDEKVQKAIDAQAQKRREQQGRMMSDWAKRREATVLDSLAENHGLTPHQRGEMEKILDRRRAAMGEFFGTLFGGGGRTRRTAGADAGTEQTPDMAAIGEKMQTIRAESDEQIKNLLSPTQYDAFKEDDRMGRGPGMGRGMGGR
jgi:hypothetical protein